MCRDLLQAAIVVLRTNDCIQKSILTRKYVKLHREGLLHLYETTAEERLLIMQGLPDTPSRPVNLNVVRPGDVAKRNAGGNAEKRKALWHSIAHIESWAIDLSWDIIGRWFGEEGKLPDEFFSDWASVADDEARHFGMLNSRLMEMGSFYGEYPVHNNLWGSAESTKHDVLARLAVEHMVHEGRGLDVTPATIRKLRINNDAASADMLQVNVFYGVTKLRKGLP